MGVIYLLYRNLSFRELTNFADLSEIKFIVADDFQLETLHFETKWKSFMKIEISLYCINIPLGKLYRIRTPKFRKHLNLMACFTPLTDLVKKVGTL